MSHGTDRARRAVLTLLACALLAPQAVHAQDPRATTVQRVAREWLALVDKLDAAASWSAAGARFQEGMTPAQWADIVRRDREPRGTIVQRAVTATTFASSGPGLPDGGDYALVRFRSSFANLADGGEEVVLEVGPGYAWRVIGYMLV
jgi:Protein of unknown function (DUF4019)